MKENLLNNQSSKRVTKIDNQDVAQKNGAVLFQVKKWLTGEEICRILGISKRTLQNYRDQRRISFYQLGRKIYYKATDVDDLIERHHINARYQEGLKYE